MKHSNQVRGEKHHSAKLTESKVKAARKLYNEKFFCIHCLANIYKVAYPTMWDAINYNTWVHVK